MYELIGYAAASLTTISFLPQVIRVWRTRSVKDISLGMYLLFTSGVALWIFYGIHIHSWPMILANAATLLLAFPVLVMKIRFEGSPPA